MKQNEWDSGPQCSLCCAFIDFETLNALSKKQFIVNVIRLCSSQIWQQAYLQNKFMLYKITKYGCHSSSIAGQKHSSLFLSLLQIYDMIFPKLHLSHINLWVHKKWLKTQYNSFWDLKCLYSLYLVTTCTNNPKVTLFSSMSLSNASNIMAFSSAV